MNNALAIRDMALELARAEHAAGVREETKNWSPRIAEYLKTVGITKPAPWCCAAVVHCYDVACGKFETPLILPRTGKVVRMFQRIHERYLTKEPVVGGLFMHATDIDDPESDGHIGWVTGVSSTGTKLYTLEANTNAAGSREGDRWAEKIRPRPYANLGFIDIAA